MKREDKKIVEHTEDKKNVKSNEEKRTPEPMESKILPVENNGEEKRMGEEEGNEENPTMGRMNEPEPINRT